MAAAIITIQELGEGLDLSEEERQLLREIGNDNDTIDVNNLDETDFGTCTRSPWYRLLCWEVNDCSKHKLSESLQAEIQEILSEKED